MGIGLLSTAYGQCSLSFSYTQGGPAPSAKTCQFTITSGTGTVSFTKPSWVDVSLSPASIAPGVTQIVTVTVNSSGTSLAPGSYSGLITRDVYVNGIYQGSLTSVSVNLTVVPRQVTLPGLNVTPTSYNIGYQIGRPAPGPQRGISIATSDGSRLSYNVRVSGDTANGFAWLKVAPLSGVTPDSLGIEVDLTHLTQNHYVGTISISVPGTTNGTVNVTVNVTVMAADSLTYTPPNVTFDYELSSNGFASQQIVHVGSTGGSLPLQVSTSGESWFSVAPSSSATPSDLTVSVSTTNLGVGSRTGSIVLTSTNAPNSPVTIPITLNITPPKVIPLTFQKGLAVPDPTCFQLVADTPGAAFTVATSGEPWLVATPSSDTTPSKVCVGLQSTDSLVPGSYSGVITINGLGGSMQTRVLLTVIPPPVLSVSQSNVSFRYLLGDPVPSQSLTVTSDSPKDLPITASVASGQDWLAISDKSGNSPFTFQVTVKTPALAVGSYSGTLNIAGPPASNTPLTVTVTLEIPDVKLSVSQSPVVFVCQIGSPPPPSQSIQLTAAGADGASYAVSFATQISDSGQHQKAGSRLRTDKVRNAAITGSDWLAVDPSSGKTPASISLTPTCNNVTPGLFATNLLVTAPAAPTTQPLVLVTLAATYPKITLKPSQLTFNVQAGGNQPASQGVAVGSTGKDFRFTVTAADNWVLVDKLAGQTPSVVSVSVDSSHLSTGLHKSMLTISSPGSDGPQSLPISVVVRPNGTISVSPTALSFNTELKFDPPPTAYLSVLGSNNSFNVTARTDNGVAWLQAGLVSGTTPATIPVTVVPSGLDVGVYRGSIRIAASTETIVPVTLQISDSGSLFLNTGDVSFEAQLGTRRIQSKTILVSSTGDQIGFKPIVIGGAYQGLQWLSSPSGHLSTGQINPATGAILQSPAALALNMNPAALPVGSYEGSVAIQQDGADPDTIPSSLTIRVRLTVTENHLRLPYLIDGGGSRTSMTVVNTDSEPAQITWNFYNAAGGPLTVPLSQFGTVATFSTTVAVGNSLTISTDGSSASNIEGWAEIIASKSVRGFATVDRAAGTTPPSHVELQLMPVSGAHFPLAFDNTQQSSTVFYLVNPNTSQSSDVSLVLRDENGSVLANRKTSIAPLARQTIKSDDEFTVTRGVLGWVEVVAQSDLTAVAVRSSSQATLVAIVPSQPATGLATLAHITDGGGWISSLLITNTGTAPAKVSARFLNSDGTPWNLSISNADPSSEYSDLIPAGGSRLLTTANANKQALGGAVQIQGSAGTFVATALYRIATDGDHYTEGSTPLLPMDLSTADPPTFMLPFNTTLSGLTAVALFNQDPGASATINAVIKAANGQRLGERSLKLDPLTHSAFLVADLWPETKNSNGYIELTASGASIAALGWQVYPDGSFAPFFPVRK